MNDNYKTKKELIQELNLLRNKISKLSQKQPESKNADILNQKLQESETRFSMLMQQSPLVIEIYNLDGLQVSVNKAYEELWQFPASTTVNKFNVLKSKEVTDTGLIEFVNRAYDGESVKVPDYEFDPKGETESGGHGRNRWLSTKIFPLKDKSGTVTNIVIVHEDVTVRKEADLELKKHREQLEELVKERTKDLEAKNKELDKAVKVFVGRELTIRNLQATIRALKGIEDPKEI